MTSTFARGAMAVTVAVLASLLTAASASAAGGCGFGYHRGAYGRCAANRPGPSAVPAPDNPGCWRTATGKLRCYPTSGAV